MLLVASQVLSVIVPCWVAVSSLFPFEDGRNWGRLRVGGYKSTCFRNTALQCAGL